MRELLLDDLKALLGDAGFIALVQAFGGTRLYVPEKPQPDSELVTAIGEEAARRLTRRYAPDVLRVPLAREELAIHYRAAGLSNRDIARKLRITETGVNKLFRRRPDTPVKGAAQLPLFD